MNRTLSILTLSCLTFFSSSSLRAMDFLGECLRDQYVRLCGANELLLRQTFTLDNIEYRTCRSSELTPSMLQESIHLKRNMPVKIFIVPANRAPITRTIQCPPPLTGLAHIHKNGAGVVSHPTENYTETINALVMQAVQQAHKETKD